MIGFLKRDFYLMLPSIRTGAVLIAVFAVVGMAAEKAEFYGASFAAVYAVIFMSTGFLSLNNCDEFNHWPAYACSVPGGRRTAVQGRYLLALLGNLILMGGGSLLCLADPGQLPGLLYGALGMAYTAVVLPVGYKFGAQRSRIITVCVLAGLVATGVALLKVLEDNGVVLSSGGSIWTVAAVAAAASLLVLAASYVLSVHIVEGKEFT